MKIETLDENLISTRMFLTACQNRKEKVLKSYKWQQQQEINEEFSLEICKQLIKLHFLILLKI